MNGLLGIRFQNFFSIGFMIIGWMIIWSLGNYAYKSLSNG